MAVAITSTVNLVFGSQVMDPITGVLLNDEVRFIKLYVFQYNTFRLDGRFLDPGCSERLRALPLTLYVLYHASRERPCLHN